MWWWCGGGGALHVLNESQFRGWVTGLQVSGVGVAVVVGGEGCGGGVGGGGGGGSLDIVLFIVVIPGVMIPLHVLSESQFRGWVTGQWGGGGGGGGG